MPQFKVSITTGLVLIAAVILTASPAIADKPSWAGGGKHEKHEKHENHEKHGQRGQHHDRDRNDGQGNHDDRDYRGKDRPNSSDGRYFIDQHRTVIRNYYANEYRTGHCPPGLVRKRNGCMPPGQARKWTIGRPLPRNVIFYDLPPAVMLNITPPPPGNRLVRVASDILMITTGTGIVRDAINNFGNY